MIKGNLVGLRPLEIEDSKTLQVLFNDTITRNLVVGWDWMVSSTNQEKWISEEASSGKNQRLAIVDLENGKLIGLTGLWDIDWQNHSALSAVKLTADSHKKGAGTDAIKLVSSWSFYEVGLRRLWGSILPFNVTSLEAYVRKSGWVVEGRERNSIFRGGKFYDLIRVAQLREDFELLPDWEEYKSFITKVDMSLEWNSRK